MNNLWISIIIFPALLSGGSFIPQCVKGKEWHDSNTDYEVFEGDGRELIVVVKCTLPDYYHQGVHWFPCVESRWQQPLPQCKYHGVSCKELPIPNNGYRSCDATAPAVGSKCSFSCEATHYLKGSRNRKCEEEGKWTGTDVRCIIRSVCPLPPPLHNGTVIGCSARNIPRFGSKCHFKCNKDFILVGPNNLTCRSNGDLTDDVGAVLYPRCHDFRDPCAKGSCSHYCRTQYGVAECFCYEGYKLHEDGKKCIDINECEEQTHQCQQTCLNKAGSYSCTCVVGYTRENKFYCKRMASRSSFSHIGQGRARQTSQRRSAPCEELNGGCDHICDDSSGFVKCKCKKGYDLSIDEKTCKILQSYYETRQIDQANHVPITRKSSVENPCSINNGGCEHKCENINGFATCSCYAGFKLAIGGKMCQIKSVGNPCRIGDGGCQHICEEVDGFATCSCHAGFKLAIDGKMCQKSDTISYSFLNTCAYKNGGCSEICNDETGTVRCSCKQGFKLLPDNRTCVAPYLEPCFYGGCSQNCNGETGTAQCSCKQGYKLLSDKRTCVDIDECVSDNFNCSELCENLQGSARCACKKGFKLMKDGKHCTDIDECAHKTLNKCDQKCHNTNGSYKCSCGAGYVPITDFKCEDIDECLSDNFNCSDICVNLQGSARCACKRGFKLMKDGKHCTDIDECANKALNKCDQKCHNTNGSYKCSCDVGYVLITDFKCEGCRINSYRSSSDTLCIDCPLNSHTDSKGKASLADCLCNDGFNGNITENEPCRDFDECSIANFRCSNICVNTPGSAHCTCPQGFELQEDQKTCSDINECKLKNGGCQGICHNSLGSFRCSCPRGYTISTSDSYACVDIDECEENNGGCSQDCVNFPGAHYCSCPVGSQLGADGKSCHTLHCPGVAVPHYSSLRCAPKGDRTAKTNYTGGEVTHKFPIGTYCWLKCNKGFAFEESSKNIECQSNGMWNDTLEECKVLQCPPLEVPENGDVHPIECKEGLRTVKEKCYFTCNEGYFMEGNNTVFTCKNKLQWDKDSIPKCLPEKTIPFITCPNDIRVNLMLNENSANITVPSPESNMKHLQVNPDWAKIGETVTFPAGKTDIVFIAKNPHFEDNSSSCTMSVSVVDMEFPTFLHCPSIITIRGNNIEDGSEHWVEPEAVDNVGIKSVTKTADLNSNWPPGIHTVEYIAEDLAGNIANCSFEIHVTNNECGDLDDPENGEANCMDWLYGKLCEPSCNENYTMSPNATQFYACDDSGTWSPSNVVPACLPECGFEEVWSEHLQQCVTIALTADADTE